MNLIMICFFVFLSHLSGFHMCIEGAALCDVYLGNRVDFFCYVLMRGIYV